jgi:hypothetical protein
MSKQKYNLIFLYKYKLILKKYLISKKKILGPYSSILICSLLWLLEYAELSKGWIFQGHDLPLKK